MELETVRGTTGLFRRLTTDPKMALERIHAVYLDPLTDQSKRIVCSNDLAKAIAMDTLQTLWENRERVAGMQNPEGWLFRCADRNALNVLRGEKRRGKLLKQHGAPNEVDTGTEQRLAQRDMARRVEEARQKLPPQQQRIIQLRNDYGLSRKEIAQRCHLSENTVRNHVAESYRTLRGLLGDLFEEYFR